MNTFNACTNNKAIGGYLMLSDLFTHNDKEAFQQLAQVVVEHLSWEIHQVTIENDTALANVTIHNKDFSNAIGMFVGGLILNINEQQQRSDFAALVRTTIKEAKNSPETIIPYLKNCQKELSVDITIKLTKIDNNWQIQLDDSLCNSLTGYLDTENFSESIATKISAVEELLNHNRERWGVEEKTGSWLQEIKNIFS